MYIQNTGFPGSSDGEHKRPGFNQNISKKQQNTHSSAQKTFSRICCHKTNLNKFEMTEYFCGKVQEADRSRTWVHTRECEREAERQI